MDPSTEPLTENNPCEKCRRLKTSGRCYVYFLENDGLLSSINPNMRKKAARILQTLYSAVDKKRRSGELETWVLSTTAIYCNGDIRLRTNKGNPVPNGFKDYYTIEKAVAILLNGVE